MSDVKDNTPRNAESGHSDAEFSAKRFILSNAIQFWVLAMTVLALWLGVEQGLRDIGHWLIIAAMALVGGLAWAGLMWIVFARPRLERLYRSNREGSKRD